ncbi:nitroreductase/quinone reductase family protein [Yinghuangia seranimata]|uniref:nitroreductase/quinone reductase family protein n=1 Tax=Yinghuangia seranimata TaxID=408067 RepID=UPI00248C7077|nr:nitroreductase/quinone reductase family protein [Yinghuangia seranimata]MDI2129871.1 nitroreductase/quinone reductase family protein [Yinghuangia seranimata]
MPDEPDEPDEEITDSPVGWVHDQIRRYVETDGEDGHHTYGIPMLLLTTRGRRTGRLRRTALVYGRDPAGGGVDDAPYLVVGSNGGKPPIPAWCLNLATEPAAEIQVGADRVPVLARVATPEEKTRLWPVMLAVHAPYEEMQNKAGRDLPVLILTPVR